MTWEFYTKNRGAPEAVQQALGDLAAAILAEAVAVASDDPALRIPALQRVLTAADAYAQARHEDAHIGFRQIVHDVFRELRRGG